MTGEQPGYIVVEGPIGVGKTSLAQRLATHFGSELLLEEAEQNPFLERFYADPRGAALPTQLYFLFQRVRQMKALRQGDLFHPVRVADFLMQKDRLFAQLNLDDDEFDLYEQAYQHVLEDVPKPDLVIYLQAPVSVLMERIKKRNRFFEQPIDSAYLQRLVDAYAQFFYQYDESPLLIVNASEIDPVSNDLDYEALVEQLCSIKSGRHFFNPLPFELSK